MSFDAPLLVIPAVKHDFYFLVNPQKKVSEDDIYVKSTMKITTSNWKKTVKLCVWNMYTTCMGKYLHFIQANNLTTISLNCLRYSTYAFKRLILKQFKAIYHFILLVSQFV